MIRAGKNETEVVSALPRSSSLRLRKQEEDEIGWMVDVTPIGSLLLKLAPVYVPIAAQ